jgi:hypothetical protein
MNTFSTEKTNFAPDLAITEWKNIRSTSNPMNNWQDELTEG